MARQAVSAPCAVDRPSQRRHGRPVRLLSLSRAPRLARTGAGADSTRFSASCHRSSKRSSASTRSTRWRRTRGVLMSIHLARPHRSLRQRAHRLSRGAGRRRQDGGRAAGREPRRSTRRRLAKSPNSSPGRTWPHSRPRAASSSRATASTVSRAKTPQALSDCTAAFTPPMITRQLMRPELTGMQLALPRNDETADGVGFRLPPVVPPFNKPDVSTVHRLWVLAFMLAVAGPVVGFYYPLHRAREQFPAASRQPRRLRRLPPRRDPCALHCRPSAPRRRE